MSPPLPTLISSPSTWLRAQALTDNTQIQITGLDVANDLIVDAVTALGVTTLDQLNGVDGIAVQVNPISGETLVNFGPDADGDVIAITLVGVVDSTSSTLTSSSLDFPAPRGGPEEHF